MSGQSISVALTPVGAADECLILYSAYQPQEQSQPLWHTCMVKYSVRHNGKEKHCTGTLYSIFTVALELVTTPGAVIDRISHQLSINHIRSLLRKYLAQ